MKPSSLARRVISQPRLFLYLTLVITASAALIASGISPAGEASVGRSVQEPSIVPAAGENCAGATEISPAALPFLENSTTNGAANDVDPGITGCVFAPGPDVVYSFTPSATDTYTIGVTPMSIDYDAILYVVTDCASAGTTCVAGIDLNPVAKGEQLTPTLTAGTRYFIVVDGRLGNSGDFHFALRRGLPANDSCSTPVVIEANRLPFSTIGTTFGAADDSNPGVPCMRSNQSARGGDVVFQFTPADTQNYIVTVTPIGNYDTSVYIVTNCTTLVGCTSADIGGNGDAEVLRRNLSEGATYFIVVDGFGGDRGDFTIMLEPSIPLAPDPPSNLVATAISATEIRLDWMDESDNELGFRIERSLDAFTFTEIASVGSNVTTFRDTTVFPSTTFFYQVKAFNNFGNSPPSNIAAATTPAPPPPPAPVISVSPSPVDFGSVRTTATKTVTVSNNGGTNLVISGITGPGAPFSFVDLPAFPITLGPGQSIDLTLRFSPSAARSFSSSFSIQSNDPANPNLTVNVMGIGTAEPVANFDVPTTLVLFPNGSSSVTFEVKNTGDADLLIASATAPAFPFSVSGVPPLPTVVKPGEGFLMTISFSPSTIGVYQGSFRMVNNDPDQLIVTFFLRGTATPQSERFKLKAPAQFTAIAGSTNTVVVIAVNGTNTDIRLSATSVAGGVFTDRGNGRGDLMFTPPFPAGRVLVTFTARDSQNVEKSVQTALNIVTAAESRRVQVLWTAPTTGTNPPTGALANDLSITPLAVEASALDAAHIDPAQPTGLAGYVIYRSQNANVALALSNVVGVVPAGQTSFIDNLPPAPGSQTFFYVVSALYGTGTESGGSNETSTAPRMIGLEFKKKSLRMQADNSNIAAGAVAIVDGRETYALTRSGSLIVAGKTARSMPGGLKPVNIFRPGQSHTVQVRNPNGAASTVQTLTR